MSDSHDTKGRSIPSWQNGDSSSEPVTPSGTRDPSSLSSQDDPQRGFKRDPHASRASLLDQATKFLQDHDIRDASVERKTAFLESKGLTKVEIAELLAVPPSKDDSSDDSKKKLVKDLQVSRTISAPIHVLNPSYRPIYPNCHRMTAL